MVSNTFLSFYTIAILHFCAPAVSPVTLLAFHKDVELYRSVTLEPRPPRGPLSGRE